MDSAAHDEPVVGQLAEVWASLLQGCEQVPPERWGRGTDCPGWTAKDQLSHLIGVERMLLGDPAPPVPDRPPPHVVNDFGALNEAWVGARRPTPGSEVLDELAVTIGRRLDALRPLSVDDFDALGWGPQGEVPLRELLRTRIIDTWAHEQDIRRAFGRPGGRNGAGEAVVLDHCAKTMPYVVGKRVAPPDGTTVSIEVTGPLGPHLLVSVEGGRASESTPVPSDPPTVAVTLDQETFWRLCYGRVAAGALSTGRVAMAGDRDLGRRVLGAMAFMT